VERKPGKLWDSLPAAYTMESVYKAEPTVHEIEVDISPTQRKHYRELEEEAITWLKDNPLAIDLPSVLHIRLRQVCLAVPSVEQGWKRRKDKETGEWEDYIGDIVWFDEDAKSSKIDALLEILTDLYAEKPIPVLVFTDSRLFATIVTKRLQAKKYRARQFVGGMSNEERLWKLENFGKKFDIMVCVISAIAEGTDGLQHVSNTEVWMNYGYWSIQNDQAEGRLSRQGQTKTVQRFVIMARDTVETNKQLVSLAHKKEQLALGYKEKEAA
jgi:SNF2 family DNA or RNA helicase